MHCGFQLSYDLDKAKFEGSFLCLEKSDFYLKSHKISCHATIQGNVAQG